MINILSWEPWSEKYGYATFWLNDKFLFYPRDVWSEVSKNGRTFIEILRYEA